MNPRKYIFKVTTICAQRAICPHTNNPMGMIKHHVITVWWEINSFDQFHRKVFWHQTKRWIGPTGKTIFPTEVGKYFSQNTKGCICIFIPTTICGVLIDPTANEVNNQDCAEYRTRNVNKDRPNNHANQHAVYRDVDHAVDRKEDIPK
mmetsp:Transcript_30615/g.46981  ORF Transcript_30615/g.46981 Transcript_30615/m.46981 type:complete len:148 (+) Transcript_30615:657-1100(+)